MNLFNLTKKKTTNDVIKLLSLGILIPLIVSIIENWSLYVALISNIGNENVDFVDQTAVAFFIIAASFLCIIVLIAFYKRKRIAWIATNIYCYVLVLSHCIYLILASIWIVGALFDSYLHSFSVFSFKALFKDVFIVGVGIAFIVLISKKSILKAFRVKKTHKIISLGISIAVVLFWTFAILPEELQAENDYKRNLPRHYYQIFDFPFNPAVVSINTDNPRVKRLFYRGIQAGGNRNFPTAILFLEQALQIEPKNTDILTVLAHMHARNNEIRRGITFLDRAIEIDGTIWYFFNDRGLMYYKLFENEKAIKNYHKALQIDSTNWIVHFNLALAYVHERMWDDFNDSMVKAEKLGADETMLEKVRIRFGGWW